MTVLVRLMQITRDDLASEAEAREALAALAQRENFLGGRLGGPSYAPRQATRRTRTAESWSAKAFVPATRGTLPEGAREVPVAGAAFRMCGLEPPELSMNVGFEQATAVAATKPGAPPTHLSSLTHLGSERSLHGHSPCHQAT